jgi:hypothetical protein
LDTGARRTVPPPRPRDDVILSVGGAADGWAARGLLGFVAGFSEPFFLKTVARVTSLVEKKEKKGEEKGRRGPQRRRLRGFDDQAAMSGQTLAH